MMRLAPGDNPFESLDDEWERHQNLRRGRVVRGGTFRSAATASRSASAARARPPHAGIGGGGGGGGLRGGLGSMQGSSAGLLRGKPRRRQGAAAAAAAPAYDRPVPGAALPLKVPPRRARAAPLLVARNSTLLVGSSARPRPSTAAGGGHCNRLRTPLRPTPHWTPPPSRGATAPSPWGGRPRSPLQQQQQQQQLFGGRDQQAQIWVSPSAGGDYGNTGMGMGGGGMPGGGMEFSGYAQAWVGDVPAATGGSEQLQQQHSLPQPQQQQQQQQQLVPAATDVHWRGGAEGWERVGAPRLVEEKRAVDALGSSWVDEQMQQLQAEARSAARGARSDVRREAEEAAAAAAAAAAAGASLPSTPSLSLPSRELFAPYASVSPS